MNESSLKKCENKFRCVGILHEKALKLSDGTVKIYKDGKPTGEEKDCEVISGRVSVKTDTGVQTYGVYFTSLGMDGAEPKQWKMAQAMMDKWEPVINGSGEEPTLVAIRGDYSVFDGYTQKGNFVTAMPRWNVRSANTRVSADDPKGCTLTVTAYINKIVDEVVNDEETGRLAVELLVANNKGEVMPINAFVLKEAADDFNDIFEVGQTASFDIDVITTQIGGKKSGRKAFGSAGKVDTNTEFDRTELIIAGADEPIEEPDELTYEDEDGNEHEIETDWMNPKTVKKAIKARAAMLEEKKNNPLANDNKNSKGGSKQSALKAEKSKRAMGKAKVEVEDDDEDEFGDDPF